MADFTEKQIYEALGLGEQEQELADPVQTDPQVQSEEGEQEQELADPAQDEDQDPVDTQTEPAADAEHEEEAETGADGSNKPLTQQQRRENAARRRREEQQAAINKAVEEALAQQKQQNDREMELFFSRAGLKNTVTGEPITSMEQFDTWHRQFEEAKLERELKSGKLTQEGLATAISKHPVVQQAQQLIDRNAQEQKQQRTAAAQARIDAEIAQIHEIDASINTVEDLFKAPYGKELYAMTQRGYFLKDAHFLLNHERLEQARADAARQQSMNNSRSKDHMRATAASRGSGMVSVPQEELRLFRLMNPNASDAEIQAYYNKNLKK